MTDEELYQLYNAAFAASATVDSGLKAALRAVFLAGARSALEEADHTEIERYEGDGKRRQWGRYTTAWLYPGDRVWIVNFDGQRAAPPAGEEK